MSTDLVSRDVDVSRGTARVAYRRDDGTVVEYEYIQVALCEDCLMYSLGVVEHVEPSWDPNYNPDTHEGDGWSEAALAAHAAAVERNWDGWEVIGGTGPLAEGLPDGDIVERDYECEGHFSWSRCDGCGSTLGGNRYDSLASRERIIDPA